MIDQSTVQKILDSANIVDVVSDFVNLRKRGINYVGLCPFHSDRNPSFYVSPSKNICKCFSCGEGGTPLHFIMKHEQLDYVGALKFLAHKYNIPIEEREETEEEKAKANERESLFIVNEFAGKFFQNQLFETEEGKNIGLSYFLERGLRVDTLKQFGLGYSPESRTALTEEALKNGYQEKYLIESGLSIKYEDNKNTVDRFRGRVIFPVYTISGKIVAFGGRILGKKDKTAKYVNSPENLIYSKSRELYGLYQAKRSITRENKCFLVEGYMDVLSMCQSGIENVVSSSGTALTTQQIKLLHRFTENITVLYDGDAAGIKAALRGIDLLLEEGLHIKVVLLPDGEDPDSFAQSHTAEEFNDFIKKSEVDFISFKTSILLADSSNDPIKRAELISDIVESIALIPEPIERAVYVQSTSQRLEIDEQLLLSEVKKRREQRKKSQYGKAGHTAQVTTTPETTPLETGTESPVALQTTETEKPYRQINKDEIELLKQIIRNGNTLLRLGEHINAEKEEDEYIPLSLFIQQELYEEDILFGSTIFRTILDEAVSVCLAQQLDTVKYFTNHPSAEISRIAVEMVTDRYRLSKVYDRIGRVSVGKKENQEKKEAFELGLFVTREIYNIKNNYILEKIRDIQSEIIEAQRSNKNDRIIELMHHIAELNELKAAFAQALGERTVI